jgi:hypothetical protein
VKSVDRGSVKHGAFLKQVFSNGSISIDTSKEAGEYT